MTFLFRLLPFAKYVGIALVLGGLVTMFVNNGKLREQNKQYEATIESLANHMADVALDNARILDTHKRINKQLMGEYNRLRKVKDDEEKDIVIDSAINDTINKLLGEIIEASRIESSNNAE